MLILKIISPDGIRAELSCDSISLTVRDNEQNKGGGSYGIRRGHAAAIIATKEGQLTAKTGGETVFSQSLPPGTAFVDKDAVTVLI